jgi:predicted nucleotidyltransferase
MNAAPILARVARALTTHRLDAVIIGNAGAALHGSPVTTLDIDFLFRKTPTSLRKLKAVADDLGAMVLRPYYPASQLYRVVRDSDGLQLDFMVRVDGIRSYEALRARAVRVEFGEAAVWVAPLADIIKRKERANREQDRAVLPVLRRTLHEQESQKRDSR